MESNRRSKISAGLAVLVVMWLTVTSPAVIAQGAPVPAQPTTPAPAVPPPTEPYSYDPQGRRDPFVSLSSRASDLVGTRSAGLAGVTTDELVVTGVMQSRGAYVALTHGPDRKPYIVRVKDRLADGTVSSITPQGMVILQEVSDRLSAIKLREVHKGLRDSEDAK